MDTAEGTYGKASMIAMPILLLLLLQLLLLLLLFFTELCLEDKNCLFDSQSEKSRQYCN